MHHPALPADAAEDAHRQAGFAHSPGLAPMHEKARGRTGLEEPGCAGIEVYAHEVEGRAALLVALERQRHVHEPGRKLCGKARFEQACRQLCGEVAVYCRRTSRSHAVAEYHLGRCRAAELLDRVAGDLAPRRRARRPEYGPEQGLFGKEQGGHPLAGEHLRRLEAAAADMPHLPGQSGQLFFIEAGAGQRHCRPGAAQIVQRHSTFQRRRPQLSKQRRHPARLVGLRASGTPQLFAEDAQCIGHGAVLLREGRPHGLGVDAGLPAAAVECKRLVPRRAERRRVDAPRQLTGQKCRFQMAFFFQNGAQGLHSFQRGGVLLLPADFPPSAVGAKAVVDVVDDPSETLAPAWKSVVHLVHRLRQRGEAFGHRFQPGRGGREARPLVAGRVVLFEGRHQPARGQQGAESRTRPGTEQKAERPRQRLDAEHPRHTAARIGRKPLHPSRRGKHCRSGTSTGKPGGGRRKGRV